jgi:predicted nucleic acid-binding protein
MTNAPEPGHKIIGKGEASSIALAKVKGGVVASNNLADILDYIQKFQLEHITTGMIMKKAFEQGLLSEMKANEIWASMLGKRRTLGAASFSEYLKSYYIG